MKIRELYFTLISIDSEYINKTVIKELLCFVLKIDNKDLLLSFDDEIDNDLLKVINKDIELIKDGYPLQYITNNVNFCSLDFFVDERVLIPRVETEQLVELSSTYIAKYFDLDNLTIFDVCSGSGVIGLSIKNKFKRSNVYLFDISKSANEVALINAKKLNLDVNIIESNCLEYPLINNIKADVIISNPPYIFDKNKVDYNVYKYEPSIALFSSTPTEFYEKIISQGLTLLKDKGMLIFELEESTKEYLLPYLNKINNNLITYNFLNDMYNKCRFLIIKKNL